MAMTNHHIVLEPQWPEIDALPTRAELDYDPEIDSLLVAFDPTCPAEHVYLDIDGQGYVALRLALDTGEVVGIEVEDLHSVALPRHPAWHRLVELAGINAPQSVAPASYSVIAAFIADIRTLAQS
jgi:hypothetical protein